MEVLYPRCAGLDVHRGLADSRNAIAGPRWLAIHGHAWTPPWTSLPAYGGRIRVVATIEDPVVIRKRSSGVPSTSRRARPLIEDCALRPTRGHRSTGVM